jgi:transposase-like protein
MARRHYSDEERAACLAALDANGGNLGRTARQVGVPESTLKGWRDAPDAAAPAEVRARKKEELADLLEAFVRSSVGQLDAKLAAADFRDASTGIAILIDKMRLLRGESTAIHESRDDERLAQFRARYSADAAGAAGADGGPQPAHPAGARGDDAADPLP